MWPYWLLFAAPASLALVSIVKPEWKIGLLSAHWTLPWFVAVLLLSLLVGLRIEVGGDWFNYLEYLGLVRGTSLLEAIKIRDPGYMLLNWACVDYGLGVYGINLCCGFILAVGLAQFCQQLPRPWLALAAAVPYLVIVVGMGYTRQAVALGFAMLGLASLMRESVAGFLVWVTLGAMFHKTAVILFPIAVLANSRHRFLTFCAVAVVAASAYASLLADSVDGLIVNYIDRGYQSEGALVRLMMNAVPAIVLLWRIRSFTFAFAEEALWRWLSVISLVLLGIYFISPATTALDRIALYMLPLQLVVAARLPDAMGRPGALNLEWVAIVLFGYGTVEFVWLNFASHAQYWFPYRNLLVETLSLS